MLILEAILGGNGHWFEFPDTTITPRHILFPLILLSYIASKIIAREFRFPRIMLGPHMLIFSVLVVGSVVHALVKGNPEPLQEAQVWFYLILYPLILDLWRTGEIPVRPFRILIWSTVAMALFQILLMLFVNLFPELYGYLYANTPIGEMRILISRVPETNLLYVFWGNSALCGVLLAISLLIVGSRGIRTEIVSRAVAWKIMILMCLAMVFSMTRGTWGQLALTIMVVGFDLVIHRKISWSIFLPVGFVFLGMILTWSELPFVRNAFSERIETLLADKATLDVSDSLVIKSIEQSQLCAAIAAKPFFGFGFGVGDYREFGDMLADTLRFHNYFLGFALKTGLIGLVSLLFLLLGGCLWAIRVGNIVRYHFPELRALLFGMAYSFAGIFLATTSNPHLGVPAVIVTFALMLAMSDSVFNEFRRHTSIMYNSDRHK